MRKCKDYRIIEGHKQALEKEVRALVLVGWEPTGGLCRANYDFHQAMVLYEKKQPTRNK